MDLRHQPPGSEPGALAVELQGKSGSASRTCTGLASLPTMYVAAYALAESKWSGTPVLPRVFAAPAAAQMALRDPKKGDIAPRVRRSERRGLLSSSCPREWWSHGESSEARKPLHRLPDAQRQSHPDLRAASTPSCCWTMAPEMERAPGLPLRRPCEFGSALMDGALAPAFAPGKSGVAARRLDGFGMARAWRMGRPTGAAPVQRSSQDRMLAVTSQSPSGKRSSGRRCPGMVSFTRGVHCWPLPRRHLKMALPRGLAPRTSAFARRHAALLHLGSLESLRHAGAAPAPAVWNAWRASAPQRSAER
jgi:hypothetical protein